SSMGSLAISRAPRPPRGARPRPAPDCSPQVKPSPKEPLMPLIPIVIERSGREERAMDIFSRLLQDRIIILGTAIDDNVANLIVAQMLVLTHQDDKADIHLYINSPGGSVTAGMAIYDTMQYV